MRRAATSVPTNLVEGSARRTLRDYTRFVEVALGSASELEYLLVLCTDLDLLRGESVSHAQRASAELVRGLHRLLDSLKALAADSRDMVREREAR